MKEKILNMLGNNADFYPHKLEQQFPQILERITIMWNSPEFDSYLNKFMLDKRERPRQGFPVEVASEILRLSIIHSQQFGTSPANIWTDTSNIKID